MEAGLDSLAATEFTRVLSEQMGQALSSTLLFDRPTVGAISSSMTFAGSTPVICVPSSRFDPERSGFAEVADKDPECAQHWHRPI